MHTAATSAAPATPATVTLELGAAGPCLRFHGPLTIAEAEAARQDLLRLLDDLPDGALTLDLHDVHQADGAGVQLLLSLAHSIDSLHRAASVCACSAPLLEAGALLGVADAQTAFGLPRTGAPQAGAPC